MEKRLLVTYATLSGSTAEVAAAIGDDDAIGLVIIGDHADVQSPVQEADEYLSLLRGGLPLIRLDLPETTGRNNAFPCRVIEHPAVDLWSSQ